MAMLTDISLGQYYPGSSFVHRLDPRTKLTAVLVFMISLLITFEVVWLAAFAVCTLLFMWAAKLPAGLVFRNIRPFVWLFILTMIVHLFWTDGQTLLTIPLINVTMTVEGLQLGVLYAVRLALLIIIAAIMTLTTSPIELTDGLERLFQPLKKVGVPAHEIVMMLTLSLRFIPTLLEEAQRLKNAQLSRGATFEGSLKKRVQSIVPLILPLFVSAFHRADDLALAMDARCYAGGEGRTSFKQLKLRPADYMIMAASAAFLALSIGL